VGENKFVPVPKCHVISANVETGSEFPDTRWMWLFYLS